MKKTILLIITIAFYGSLSAQNGYTKVTDNKTVEQKLMNASANLKTITSDFTQEKHLEYLSASIESEGKFWFQKTNQLRWEYTSPFKYVIVVNNGKFIIKDEEKKNSFDIKSNKAFQELNDIIVSSVNGTLIQSDKFIVETFENKEFYQVKLTPKADEMKKILNLIELYFQKSDLSVNKIRMVENADDYTLITLKNKKFNEPIAANVFSIK